MKTFGTDSGPECDMCYPGWRVSDGEGLWRYDCDPERKTVTAVCVTCNSVDRDTGTFASPCENVQEVKAAHYARIEAWMEEA